MKKKALLLSILTITLLLSVVVGGTFALFTKTNSIKGNLVTVGVVDIQATVTLLGTKEQDEADFSADRNNKFSSSDLTRSVDISSDINGRITMTNIAPKDFAKFNLKITNNSSIDTKYSILLTIANEDNIFKLFDTDLNANSLDWSLNFLKAKTSPIDETFYIGMKDSAVVETASSYNFDIIVYAVPANASERVAFVTNLIDFNNCPEGGTAVLVNSINVPTDDFTITKALNIDLNGYTITANSFSINSPDYNGKLTIQNGDIKTSNGDIGFILPKATVNLNLLKCWVPQNNIILLSTSKNTLNINSGTQFYMIDNIAAANVVLSSDMKISLNENNNNFNFKILENSFNIFLDDNRDSDSKSMINLTAEANVVSIVINEKNHIDIAYQIQVNGDGKSFVTRNKPI